jgi:transcriptional regulator with XRE-family HTH domain
MSDDTPGWGHDDIPPPPPRLERARNSRHQFQTPPNQRDRDVWAAERRHKNNWTFQQIADALGIKSKGNAHAHVERGRRAPDAEREQRAAEVRDMLRERLELMHEAALEVMERKHLTVSHGRIIMIKDEATGEETPLVDDAPVLQAIDRLLKVNESARKLDGHDAAAKLDATLTTIPQNAELQERIRLAKERVADQERRLLAGEDDQAE